MEDESRGSTEKYGEELRERATRMAVELRQDPSSRSGAIKCVADQLGMHAETLGNWARQAEVDQAPAGRCGERGLHDLLGEDPLGLLHGGQL